MDRYELYYKCQRRTEYYSSLRIITTVEFLDCDILPFISKDERFDSIMDAIMMIIVPIGTYKLQVRIGNYCAGYTYTIGEGEFSLKRDYGD